MSPPRTAHLREYWDKQASGYDREMAFWERALFPGGRAWACGQASGDVLEIAAGTGLNLPFYSDDVHLTAIEFSPAMLQQAHDRAEQLGRRVDLRLGDAHALDFSDASFDTVVCTLALCTIADDRRAVAEMRRVLRPGGRLILLDHVAGSPGWVRVLQWLLERLTIPLQGEYLLRRPLDTVKNEGFRVEFSERSKLGIIERVIARKG